MSASLLEILEIPTQLGEDIFELKCVVGRKTGLLARAADQIADFARGFLRRLGKGADLAGDDGKARALVAGSGRFNGGVEGEQIGAEAHILDGGDEPIDLGGGGTGAGGGAAGFLGAERGRVGEAAGLGLKRLDGAGALFAKNEGIGCGCEPLTPAIGQFGKGCSAGAIAIDGFENGVELRIRAARPGRPDRRDPRRAGPGKSCSSETRRASGAAGRRSAAATGLPARSASMARAAAVSDARRGR